MAVYTFYICNPDGGASSFEAFALNSDAEAPARAIKMLREHPSCAYVAVWEDQRPVLERYRDASGAEAQSAVSAVEQANALRH
ncbi:MAG: hypothetical protein ACXU82_06000 [Caulobacteraceae bacterium]